MKITMTQRGLILRATRNDNVALHLVASRFAIPFKIVEAVFTGRDTTDMYVDETPRGETQDFADNGRASLRPFMIAKKAPDGLWPMSKEIVQAQKDYDAGLIEMCQGRSSKHIFLYAVPRKNPKQRTGVPYFGSMFVTTHPYYGD